MFAIVSYKGNQYKVEPDKVYEVALLKTEDKKISFDQVLLFSDKDVTKVGDPIIKDAIVEAEILGDVRDDKVKILKFKSKVHYQRRIGHRQDYTQVKILSIKA